MFKRMFTGLLIIAILAACGPAAASSPTVTLIVLPPPATATFPPIAVSEAPPPTTQAAPTAIPTDTPPPFATPTPRAASSLEPGFVDRVYIYLIKLDDNGRSGELVGCGDSVVAVERVVTPTNSPLRVALEELFSIKEQNIIELNLYNALYAADVIISRLVIENGVAKIDLTGTLSPGGVCDDPRIEAQIKSTALQFSTVTGVEVTLNGTRLEDVLSGRGG